MKLHFLFALCLTAGCGTEAELSSSTTEIHFCGLRNHWRCRDAGESLPDAGRETVPDAGGETIPDAGRETAPDAGGESIPDAGPETVPDAGAETTSDSGAFADAGTFADVGSVVDAGSMADTGVNPDAGFSSGDAGVSSIGPGLGWNLDLLYNGEFGFADKVKMSRPWISTTYSTWDDGRAISVDPQGWPTALLTGQQATTLVPVHDGGRYVITWDGAGTLVVSDVLAVASQAPNRIVVDTAAGNKLIQLRITSVPVRNLQVRKDGQDPTLVWDPTFAGRLQGARVIRFMQWGVTNGDNGGPTPRVWSDRSSPSWFTQHQHNGVSYEYMIALSNALAADAWICVPHAVDDQYIENLAILVRNSLDPSRKIYFEWSNEVWNDGFPQAWYARQEGTAAGLGGGDPHVARLQFQSRRSRRIFEIIERVFAGQMHRVVRVLGTQIGNRWNDDRMLEFEGLAAHVDALAGAPYFGAAVGRASNETAIRNGGTTWVLDQLETVHLPETISWINDAARSAAKWNVELISYEGGQHLVAEPTIHNDVSITSVLEASQRSPRMYQLYGRLLAAWDAAGGGLFVHYTYAGAWTKWGYWGSLDKNDAPLSGDGAHKYRALTDWR